MKHITDFTSERFSGEWFLQETILLSTIPWNNRSLGVPRMFVLLGTAIGIVITIAGARFISTLLFELSPQDPLTLAGAALLLMTVAGIAGIVPARRACRVDPVVALRCE